jgi:hypothetical protein
LDHDSQTLKYLIAYIAYARFVGIGHLANVKGFTDDVQFVRTAL